MIRSVSCFRRIPQAARLTQELGQEMWWLRLVLGTAQVAISYQVLDIFLK